MRLSKLALISALLSFLASSSAFAQCTGQAGANKFCGNATGSTALPTFTTIPAGSLTPIAGGTVLGNPSASSAVPSATTAPVLGIPGTSTGQLGFAGATSGTAILKPQPATGSPTLLLPNTSGTLAANATTPLVLSATTGTLTCPTCVTSSGGGAITGTSPISVSAAGVVSINAPYVSLTASNGGIVYSGATDLAILAGTATATRMLQSGSSAAPAWSTTTWPATSAAGTVLISGTANTITASATPVLGVAGSVQGTLSFAGLTSGAAIITAQAVAGTPTLTLPNASGTFAVASTSPLVLSATTGTLTCPTCVTSSGGGAITGTAPISVSAAGVVSITSPLPLTNGGTNASLTASNGGLLYSTGSALAILSGTATANQIPLSGSSAAPSWSTATYPSTAAANTILAAGSSNVIAGTATPTLGTNGGTGGQITLNGSTSGSAAIRVAAAAGTGTIFQLPPDNGTNTYVLQTNGSGVTSWVASAGGGTVTSVGWTGGIVSVGTPTTTPAFTIAGTSGGIPYFSSASTWASSAALAANAIVVGGGAGVAPSTVTTGTGIITALGVNTGSAGAPSILIASGTSALGTSAIASAACATVVTTAATGVATTDVITAGFNGDPTAVTGYAASTSGMLTIVVYPSANNVNFKVCNNTGASITPGAITLNWRVVR